MYKIIDQIIWLYKLMIGWEIVSVWIWKFDIIFSFLSSKLDSKPLRIQLRLKADTLAG